MDAALYEAIRARLETDNVPEPVAELVRTACRPRTPELVADTELADGPKTSSLRWFEVEGFRGIGEPLRLDLTPGSGLVVIAGRNGSGKSSLAEGLEALLTGTCRRWKEQSSEFAEGWRNLHHDGARRVTACFAIEGSADPVVLTRTWSGDAVETSTLTIDGRPATLAALGWIEAVETWRPTLSGDMARNLEQRPSALFDAIAGVLGLESIVDAYERLAKDRTPLQRRDRDVTKSLVSLRVSLADVEDPRAETARSLLSEKAPSLEALEVLTATEAADTGLDSLRNIIGLQLPTTETVAGLADTLRGRAGYITELSESAIGRSEQIATLLDDALGLHDGTTTDCPVCGSPAVLDEAWAEHARTQVADARRAARDLNEARKALGELVTDARRALHLPSEQVIRSIEALGLDTSAIPLAERWWAGRHLEEANALADHLQEALPPLLDAIAALQEEARRRMDDQHARWRPVATLLNTWIAERRAADDALVRVRLSTQAESWLKEVEEELRAERFQPISDQARRIWETLRQDSHVALETVELQGSRTRRKLGLRVKVDGVETKALGVMSQGELNALALSLFVPRTTMPDSPFRFVVIDDPVQALDPHKVDGLALVLGELSETRQTIVLTHDERLLESLRRLRIPASVLEARRNVGSRVTLLTRKDPVTQGLDDAHRIMSARQSVPDALLRRLVPGFCREALEARLVQIMRRRWIGGGRPHFEVEAELAKNKALRPLAALVLFDDARRGREVEDALRERIDGGAATVFDDLNRGTHGDFDGNVTRVHRETRRVIERMETWE